MKAIETKRKICGRVGLTGLLLASSAITGAGAAFAQETGGLEDLIVTAQKREENVQDIPMSVQALGTERLEEMNVTDMGDYVRLLPSVSLTTIGPGFGRIYVRGVTSGENPNHSASLPSVGTYLDEQPITTITGALDIHIYDIARVEALAGPQGTLYGASSQAGTVRIITNKPTPDNFSAAYSVEGSTIDGGGSGQLAEGYVNLPISDRIAVRLVGWAKYEPGYIDNVLGSVTFPTSGITMDNADRVEDDYNDITTYGARAALRIDLDDNWTVTPTIMAQDQRSNGIFGYDPQAGDLAVSHYFPEKAHDRWVQTALTIEGRIADFDIVYAGAFLNRDIDYRQDYTDYAFYYDTLAGYGAYFYDDLGNLINPAQYIDATDRYRKQSHELRISSPQENPLRFVAGVFYQRQEHEIHQNYLVAGDLTTAFEVPGYPDTIWLTEQDRIDRDLAVFGEVSYDLTPQLTATAGLRAFRSENSLFGFFGFSDGFSGSTGVSQCFSPFQLRGAPCTNLDKSVEEEGTTHRLTVTYDVTDDIMFYGTWSTGFRPGGINRRGNLPPYESDFLTNYEFGWKTSWMNNTVRFNGAVFLQEWDDFQYSLLGQNGLTEIQNAGAAEIGGVEADLTWAVTDAFTLRAAATWLNAETTEDLCNRDAFGVPDCASGLLAPSGTPLPVTPEFKANIVARYDFAAFDLDWFAQGALNYQSEVYNDLRTAESAIIGRNDAYTLVDLSFGLTMPEWWLTFYVDNVTDERGVVARYAECATATCGGRPYYVVEQPRTFGIRFGQDF